MSFLWLTSVISALWKAKAGGLFELRTAWATWQKSISTVHLLSAHQYLPLTFWIHRRLPFPAPGSQKHSNDLCSVIEHCSEQPSKRDRLAAKVNCQLEGYKASLNYPGLP
ncbi:uncharacterized protein LOC144340323 [Macaca mulatta]